MSLEPAYITREPDHSFVKGVMAVRGGKRQRICETCGYVKNNVIHHAFPRSINAFGSGSRGAYIGTKSSWGPVFYDMTEASDLPRLGEIEESSIRIEGELTFGSMRGGKRGNLPPDKENYRSMLSKIYADVLVEGGWLYDDSWWHFSFGELGYTYEKDVWRLELMIFPALGLLDQRVIKRPSGVDVAGHAVHA